MLNRLREAIVYEDDHYLAICKPAGLASHGGTGIAYGVIEAARGWGKYEFLELAHRLALGRAPTPEEVAQAAEFITAYLAAPVSQARPEDARQLTAWQSYCQTLFCSNEFLYVE